jgi:hypothetical protein
VPEESESPARPEPPRIPNAPDPVAPIFFVSHATAYGNSRDVPTIDPNSPFATFFRDLSQDVNQLVARRAGADPGFLDRGLRAGVDWEHEILAAVGTCQVFIALLSAPFALSDYCGREYDGFSRRRTFRRPGGNLMPSPNCILPVLWAPRTPIPKVVRERQLFVPVPFRDLEFGQDYLREGVYGLYMAEQRRPYRATVWRLAQEIQRLVQEYWVEPRIPKRSEELNNVFEEGEEESSA